VSPPPSNYHQGLAFELATLLRRHHPPGYRVLSPGTVELAPNHHRQPDLLVLAATAVRRGQPPAARPADVFLADEVMSPGSVTEDRITKPAVSARAGIPYYWRLESGDEGELALYVYRLAGDVYTEAPASVETTGSRSTNRCDCGSRWQRCSASQSPSPSRPRDGETGGGPVLLGPLADRMPRRRLLVGSRCYAGHAHRSCRHGRAMRSASLTARIVVADSAPRATVSLSR
jgi:hypothetical protein